MFQPNCSKLHDAKGFVEVIKFHPPNCEERKERKGRFSLLVLDPLLTHLLGVSERESSLVTRGGYHQHLSGELLTFVCPQE